MPRLHIGINRVGIPVVALLLSMPQMQLTATPSCAIEQEDYAVEAASDNTTRFAVIGDFGLAGEKSEAVADMVKSWEPDFIITTGDNNYPEGLAENIDENIGQYYHAYIGDYQGTYGEGSEENRFFPVLGNHDWGFGDIEPYLDYFTLPNNERYYSVLEGSVEFFMLDSDTREPDGVSSRSVQGKWLQEALANSTAAFQIVVFHHAAYSSGEDGSADWMQWPFAEWGVDLVLSGHNHTYERIEVDGLTYIVNGIGGQSLYAFATPVEGSQARYNCNFGALVADVTDNNLLLRFITIGEGLVDTVELKRAHLNST